MIHYRSEIYTTVNRTKQHIIRMLKIKWGFMVNNLHSENFTAPLKIMNNVHNVVKPSTKDEQINIWHKLQEKIAHWTHLQQTKIQSCVVLWQACFIVCFHEYMLPWFIPHILSSLVTTKDYCYATQFNDIQDLQQRIQDVVEIICMTPRITTVQTCNVTHQRTRWHFHHFIFRRP